MLLVALLAAVSPQFPSPINLGAPPPGVELLQITAPANVDSWAEPAPVGDINGDGFDDFAFSSFNYTATLSNRGVVYVVFGRPGLASGASLSLGQLDGTNGFVMLGSVASERLGFQVAAAGDVNADGIDDLVVAASLVTNASGVQSPGAYVLFGSPQVGASGTILSSSIVPPLGFRVTHGGDMSQLFSYACGAGDMDGDGFDDVIVGSPYDGARQDEYFLSTWVDSCIATGDIDNDGDVDIVGTWANAGHFKIFHNDGTGHFTTLQYPFAGWLTDIEMHDLDSDGWLDLVFSGQNSQGVARLTTFRNQQNGFFDPAQNYLLVDRDLTFDVADINGDGFADVVAAAFTLSSSAATFQRVVPYLNDGTGALVAGTPTQLPGEPRHLKVGDLDGDGDIDVVVSCHETNAIWPLAGNGTGSFVRVGPIGGYSALGMTSEFELGDLDGDGDLDYVGSGIGVLPNVGALVFGPAVWTRSSVSAYAIELADFDSDGDLDAMATLNANSVSAEVAFLCNDGSGVFSARRNISSELTCRADVAAGDFDGDGDLDLAVVGLESGQQRIMIAFNRGGGAFNGPLAGQVAIVRGGPTAGFPAVIDLDQPNPGRAVLVPGPHGAAFLGTELGSCGDVNGDGFDDVIVQVAGGYSHEWAAGTLVVLLGSAALSTASSLDLLALDGTNGFELRTTGNPGYLVGSFGGVGDFDGDGFDDVTFAGSGVSSSNPALAYPANVYVLFGGPTVGAGGVIAPLQPDGVTLVKFLADQLNDNMGYHGVVLVDLDADGRDDLVSSAVGYDEQLSNRGAVRCVYGAPRPWPATPIVLTGLDGSWGFRVLGPITNGYTSGAVSAAGDVDGDGVEDLLFQDGGFSSGSLTDRAFLLFGQSNGAPQPYCQAKVNSLGCTPQVGWAGQLPSVSDSDPFFVTASNLLNQKFGILYYGLAGRGSSPFQGGTLCVRQPVRRTLVQNSGGSASGSDCSGTFSFDWSAWMDSGIDPNLTAGTVVDAQFWSRDPGASFTSSLTGGLEFEIGL